MNAAPTASTPSPDTGAIDAMHAAFAHQQQAFWADMQPDLATRRDRLDRLIAMTLEHEDELLDAISNDYGHRSRHETALADIFATLSAIRHTRKHLRRWMKPRRAPVPLHFQPGRNRVLRQPLGVVGVIAPWNYPYQLAIAPAAQALAAGNRVLLKPSEVTPAFSAVLQRIVAKHFDPAELTTVLGGPDVAQAFSELPFDHLLFTGAPAIGKHVAMSAAKNLTPVTLELGGKSPAIIDPDADLDVYVPRIATAKLLNAGQTCIAPDYVMLAAPQQEQFVALFRAQVAKLYPTLAANPDYTNVINPHHYQRIRRLLDDARSKGAQVIEINPANEQWSDDQHRLAPTLVLDVDDSMAIMQEEIFGPVLPVMTYRTPDEAISYVNRNPRPLALYWFGQDKTRRDAVLARTISGGVTINDCIWHVGQEDMPFGGVGNSGMGAYHGETGFLTFTKEKPVFYQARYNGMALLRPPYGKLFERMLSVFKRIA